MRWRFLAVETGMTKREESRETCNQIEQDSNDTGDRDEDMEGVFHRRLLSVENCLCPFTESIKPLPELANLGWAVQFS